MELMICRTPAPPFRRSKLEELPGDCCCDKDVKTLLLIPLSKMVGIAVAGCPIPISLPFRTAELPKIFDSFNIAVDDDDAAALFDARRLPRNDNDLKRCSGVDSLEFVGGNCFCRSNSDDTNLSSTLKSAFILEFRMVFGDIVLFGTAFDDIPKRLVICKEKV